MGIEVSAKNFIIKKYEKNWDKVMSNIQNRL